MQPCFQSRVECMHLAPNMQHHAHQSTKLRAIMIRAMLEERHYGSVPPRRTAREISEDNPPAPTVSNLSSSPIPSRRALEALFARMGYEPVARHRTKAITVWRQGDINYILRRRIRLARRARPEAEGRGVLLSRPPDPQRHQGQHGHLVGFLRDLFNFREIRFFDIEGKLTGLFSRALTSPCGASASRSTRTGTRRARSRNYLKKYKGEGIQHIAVGAATSTTPPMRSPTWACASCPARRRPITRRVSTA
jgi:hypothetical protein